MTFASTKQLCGAVWSWKLTWPLLPMCQSHCKSPALPFTMVPWFQNRRMHGHLWIEGSQHCSHFPISGLMPCPPATWCHEHWSELDLGLWCSYQSDHPLPQRTWFLCLETRLLINVSESATHDLWTVFLWVPSKSSAPSKNLPKILSTSWCIHVAFLGGRFVHEMYNSHLLAGALPLFSYLDV